MILCLFTFIVQSAYFITIIACPTSSQLSFPPFPKTMNLQNPNNGENNQTSESDLQNPNNGSPFHPNQIPPYTEEIDSSCSTPYVSAPSSPGRSFNSSSNTSNVSNGYFFSCPASPVHFILSSKFTPSSSPSSSKADPTVSGASFEFEFSDRFPSNNTLTSADELFFNGQIRPMKLSSHLQKPQILAPLVDEEDEKEIAEEDSMMIRGRDLRLRNRSLHRRTRSLSPLRNQIENHHHHHHHQRNEVEEEAIETPSTETTPSSSRSSSSGSRNSKRWVFLKDFLRSKSEGRGNSKEKFWSSISFSPATKEKEKERKGSTSSKKSEQAPPPVKKANGVKPMNGVSKRRVQQSAHELHYTTNRAQAEEMKKRTYLPYKQGLFGCLGFNSKSYGAFARALNPVSSR